MNKPQFLAMCNSALKHQPLDVVVQRAHRELHPEVALNGAWGKSLDEVYYTSQTLFTPQHHKDDFRTWNETCEARSIKFKRWLEEWKGR